MKVIVESPDGDISVKDVGHGSYCEECLGTVEDVQPWVEAADAAGSLDDDATLRDKVRQASDVKHGRETPTWATDTVAHEIVRNSSFDVVMRGHEVDVWKRAHPGADPDQAGLHCVREMCSLNGPVDVLYEVAFYERRISDVHCERHSQDALPLRLYQEQPADMLAALKQRYFPDKLVGALPQATVRERFNQQLSAMPKPPSPIAELVPTVAADPPSMAPQSSAGIRPNGVRSSVFAKPSAKPQRPGTQMPVRASGIGVQRSVIRSSPGPAAYPKGATTVHRASSDPPTTPKHGKSSMAFSSPIQTQSPTC